MKNTVINFLKVALKKIYNQVRTKKERLGCHFGITSTGVIIRNGLAEKKEFYLGDSPCRFSLRTISENKTQSAIETKDKARLSALNKETKLLSVNFRQRLSVLRVLENYNRQYFDGFENARYRRGCLACGVQWQ